MRIRTYLLLFMTVVLAPGFLAAGVAIAKVREGERQARLNVLRETVRATALLVDGQIQRSIGALTALAQSRNLQTGDFAALYTQAEAIDHKPDIWTLVLDETGAQRINTSVPFGAPLPGPIAHDRQPGVLALRQPWVSDLVQGPVKGLLLTAIHVPAKSSPVGNFVVAQAFSVNHWNRMAMGLEGRSDWITAIIDRTGKFIWRSHRANEYLGRGARPELVAAAAASHSGLIRHSTLEGVDSYDAFTHSELTGWIIAVAAPVPAIEASATQSVAWLTAGMVSALGLALLAATLASRLFLGALHAASTAARTLGRAEPLRPPRTAVLEINDLHDALHDGAQLLAQEVRARGIAEREREQLLENERLAREEAQRENQAKDRFLALLGHELRNPLAAIAGASDVLARGPRDSATQQRFVALIQRQNRHLKRIVDDLLEVSRMLSGKILLEAQPLDFAGCVRRCIESLRATERAASFRWQLRTAPVWVCGDPVRLEQIINNLVMNAMQFSPTNGEIRVTVTRAAGHAVLEVEDSGPGITPDLQARIFEPFIQGPPLPGRPSAGLGIGLSLVKQLVLLHGGEVNVRSGGSCAGSIFVVRLACIAAPQALHSRGVESNPSTVKPATECHVLVVDDNVDARESMAESMRLHGYVVSEAGDGDGALQSALSNMPDIVVMDLGLPTKTGFQVASEIKALPSICHIPLIALSGYGGLPNRAAALAAGFADCLTKPASLADLARAIATQLKQQQRGP